MKVTMFAEIEEIGSVSDQGMMVKYKLPIHYRNDGAKQTIIFKAGSLVRLSDPILRPKQYRRIRIMYSSLSNFISAKTLEDLKS